MGVGAMFVLAALSQAKLQILERENTIELANATKRFTLRKIDKARRGSIFSSDGKPLAQDANAYELTVQFARVPKSDAFFLDLANATGIAASEFSSIAESGAKSKTWDDAVSSDRAEAISEVKTKWRADGVSLKAAADREYPLGEAASCVVGVVREQSQVVKGTGVNGIPPRFERGVAATGLESSRNDLLTGQDGVRVGLTDRDGAFLPMRMEDEGKARIDGKAITLTIDSDLQDFATQAIKKAVEEHDAENGVAIVITPGEGDILAMANWPSFDPNGHIQGEFGYNPAYMAQLEPGSTFKILTLAKAMDEGKVDLNSIVQCRGVLSVTAKGKPVHCDSHHGNRAHGTTDSIKAIAKSCNVSAATWALRVGRPQMIDYIQKLGLLKRTGIGGTKEARGLFRFDEYAQTLQLAHVGFGQSITCTPLGLASAFSMLGNGGTLVPPRLIKKVGDEELPVGPGERILKEETVDKMVTCLESVIESDSGTGKDLRIPGYRLGGKTGTAQKVGSGVKGYVSNFIGFVPARNPRAVVLVMVNNPKKGYYGATVAGPAFKEIAKQVIRHFNIPPSVTSKAGQ
ncbi:MAG: peptidoglycan D,D-transpeptidase FtsI family protein [Fimbriimonas sp.]